MFQLTIIDGYRSRELLDNGRLVGKVYAAGLIRLERREMSVETDHHRQPGEIDVRRRCKLTESSNG